jgi:hypothetical protein
MKKIINFLAIAVALGGITLVSSCHKDSNPSPNIKNQVAKTWVLNRDEAQPVTVDGYNKTPDYTNFALTVTNSGSYTIAGNATKSVWPNSGSFTYSDVNTTNGTTTFKLTRQDNLQIACTLTGSKLSMSFTFNETVNQGNRVSGQWTFLLQAN